MVDINPPHYFEAEKKRLAERISYWEARLGLGWLEINHKFLAGRKADDENVAAETEAMWQYRRASVEWYTGHTITFSDKHLDNIVIHELLHVLLHPIEVRVPAKYVEQVEFAVESVTRAIEHLASGQ